MFQKDSGADGGCPNWFGWGAKSNVLTKPKAKLHKEHKTLWLIHAGIKPAVL